MQSSKLKIKQKITTQYDLAFKSKCPEPTCGEDYLGETFNRIIERLAHHCGKDKQSRLLRHPLSSNHKTADLFYGKSQKPCILNNTNHL